MSTHLDASSDRVNNLLNAAGSAVPSAVKLDIFWIFLLSFIAFLVVAGFALLASGSVRYKSVQSATITVIFAALTSIIYFWLLGYGFALGNDNNNHFIGLSKFAGFNFLIDESRNDYANLIFYTITTIIVAQLFSLGTLERSRFFSLNICLIFLTAFLYPVALHWVQPNGWLNNLGYKDFAGSGYIHLFGAVTAFLTAFFLKERRDNNGQIHYGKFPRFSTLFVGIGSLLIAFSTLFFVNAANKSGNQTAYVQGSVASNSLVAVAFGGLFSYLLEYLRAKKTSLVALSRGAVAGIVAVSASVNNIRLWEAAIIGTLGGLIYIALTIIISRQHADDPAQVIAVHLGPGIFGVIAVGLFDLDGGLLIGKGILQLGLQFVGLFAFLAWALLIAICVVPLKGFGIFKISPQAELEGIDVKYGEGEAFVFHDQVQEQQSLIPSGRIFSVTPGSLSSPHKGIFQ